MRSIGQRGKGSAGGQARAILARAAESGSSRFMPMEKLESRTLLSAALIDVGPLYQAPEPNWIGWSGSGNTASVTQSFPTGGSFTATVSGSALSWTDYSNTHPTTNAMQLVYRDGVYQAGNLTLGFSGLAPGNYALALSSIDEGTAGTAAAPAEASFAVQVTDATRTGVAVLSNQSTATMYTIASADLPSFTFSPKADGTATVVLARTGTTGNVWLNGFRIDNGVVVNDTTAPSPGTLAWATAPYAVKEGVAGVTMVAAPETDASGVQYYFENMNDPARNSGWISSPSWSDLGLAAGTTYQYHFKARDLSSNKNETAWSSAAAVTTYVDNTYAGFTTTDLGSRVPTFDFTGMRSIPHVPDPGVHPRIYTSPAELPDLRNKLATTASGQQSMEQVYAWVQSLIGGYNRSAPYAKDAAGTPTLGNTGYSDSSTYYNGLLNYNWSASPAPPNPLPFNTDGTPDMKRRNIMASEMALDAYQSWIYQGQPEFDQRARDLAVVMDNWAKLVVNDPALTPSNYDLFGGHDMAEAYDFNYNAMTPTQRADVEPCLVKIIWPTSMYYGTNVAPYATTSNWSTLDDFVPVTMMAIEGEPGYDANSFRQIMKVEYNFINYGWYHDGAPNEGLGKNYQMLGMMAAFARRDFDLVGHQNVRAFVTHYLPRILEPYGNSFSEYDDWGGTGVSSDPQGGYKFNAMDAIGGKYLFPNDPNADFVYQNYLGSTSADAYSGYLGISPVGYNDPLLVGSIESADYNTANLSGANWQAANTAAQQNQTTFFEPNRGIVISRSDFSPDAMELQVQTRQDLGGHTHADRNNFNLSALGRTWAVYRAVGSGAEGSQYHNVELIDGVGMAVGKAPGKVDEVADSAAATFAAGDAKHAYDWAYGSSNTVTRGSVPSGSFPVDETLNDFRLQKDTTDPWYDQSLFDRAYWNGPGLDGWTKKAYNPMQSAYRTTAVVRGPHPYSLVLDDYQKDSAVHDYKWLMQLPDDLSIDSTTVNADPNNYQNDIVLKEANGNRRLLIRIINANGLVMTNGAPGYIDPTTSATWHRLVIEANAVAPQFKIMLLPFTVGDAMPVTTVSNGQFTNTLDGRTDTFTFNTGADGRTRYALSRNGAVVAAEATDAAAPAAPSGLRATAVSQTVVNLKWTDNGGNPQVYKIERSTDGTNFTVVNSTLSGVTFYTDAGLTPGTTYYYRVRASNTLDSAPSGAVSVIAWPAGAVAVQGGAQTYTQNFDGLTYSLVQNVNWGGDAWLPGWTVARNDTLQFRADAGNESYPRPLSEGSGGNQALGGMPQGNGYQAQGVLFQNDLTQTISSVDVSYAAEQWRANLNGGSVKFYYKLQSSAPTFDLGASTAGWTTVSALDFNATTAATGTPLDGTAAANGAQFATTLNVSVPAGQYLWLGWRIVGGTTNNNPTLAIDNVAATFHAPPKVVQPAAAAGGNPVTTASANLSVLGDSETGEANLGYTWSSDPSDPSGVSFTFAPGVTNGSNGAKAATAHFTQPGTYTLTATLTDPAGRTANSSVVVNVVRALATLTIAPAAGVRLPLPLSGSASFTATGADQFGQPIALNGLTWTAVSGTIDPQSGAYTAPSNPTTDHITATSSGVTAGFDVSVVNTPPQLTTASITPTADANTGAVTGATLSGAATDDGGAAQISYAWTADPGNPAAVTFLSAANAAQTAIQFARVGAYSFTVTATDSGGLSDRRTVSLTVSPTLSRIAVSSAALGSMPLNSQRQFTAAGFDQFNAPLAVVGGFAWAANAGAIDATGLYTAPAVPSNPTYSITAGSGAISGSTTVAVVNTAPVISAVSVGSGAGHIAGTGSTLNALVTDDGGAANLSYNWSVTGAPGGAPAPQFAPASANPTVTFSQAGTYTFAVTVTDSGGLAATGSATVTVDQTLTAITVSPASSKLLAGSKQQFSAAEFDQFNAPMAQPAPLTWGVVAGGGTITSGGLYTVPTSAGSATVQAAGGSVAGAATVTVSVPTSVNLSPYFNRTGIYADGSTFASNGGLDGHGYAFPANLSTTPLTWGGVPFTIGAAGVNDVVNSANLVIALPQGQYSALKFLATGTGGSHAAQAFTVTYTDGTKQTFTQGISDWGAGTQFPGESVVYSSPYRNKYNGAKASGNWKVYGYTISLDPMKTVQSIKLPSASNAIDLMAITLLS